MNNRIITVIATAMLVTLTSGCCSSMSSLWFGRGASCGLCSKLSCVTPRLGNVLPLPCRSGQCVSPAPQYQTPFQGVQQAPRWQAPTCQSPTCQTPAADCGCNGYAGTSNGYAGTSNGDSYYGSAYGGGCNGECSVEGYRGGVHDPYLSGGTSTPYEGQIIHGGVVTSPGYDGQIIGGQSFPNHNVPIESDDFQSRKFDTDGNKILWEQPLPSGSNPL